MKTVKEPGALRNRGYKKKEEGDSSYHVISLPQKGGKKEE